MTFTLAGFASATATGRSMNAAISAEIRTSGMGGDDSPAPVKQA
jgi:hypothetical protein